MSNYKHYTLDDWIQCINEKLKYFDELDGNEMRDLADFLSNISQPKKGKWIATGYDYKCTNCDAEINGEINYMSESEIKYCPYCGAKMAESEG